MCLMKKILHTILPFPAFESAERVLFISPHPDDIEVAAGQTAARLAEEGKKVRFLICADGRYGSESAKTDPEKLADVREAEQIAAAKELGVEDVRFLRFSDGGFYKYEDFYIAVYKEVLIFKPDLVFCPDPCLSTECHIDHLNTGRAAMRAFLFSSNAPMAARLGLEPANPKLLAMYYTDNPNYYFKTGKKYRLMQTAALKKHVSQMQFLPDKKGSGDMIQLYIDFRTVRFGIKTLHFGGAEGFRCLTPTHAHCCAEKI